MGSHIQPLLDSCGLLEKGSLDGTISQVDGGRWVTFEGKCSVTNDSVICTDAIERYSVRYQQPKDRGDERRTIVIKFVALNKVQLFFYLTPWLPGLMVYLYDLRT